MLKFFALGFCLFTLSSCVTPYQKSGLSGGYSDEKISDNVYKVVFGGNGYTNRETVQTYWLYRACEVTIEKGFDYFEIQNSLMSGLDFWSQGYDSYVVAQVVFIPMDNSSKPYIEREIKMYKKPFTAQPPKSFDARKLQASLEPYVKGKHCSSQVCPHEKTYLQK